MPGLTPEEQRAARIELDAFEAALRAIKVGDRFVLSQPPDLYSRCETIGVPHGTKGTVLAITISGLSARVNLSFDGHRKTHWLFLSNLDELGLLDRLAEV